MYSDFGFSSFVIFLFFAFNLNLLRTKCSGRWYSKQINGYLCKQRVKRVLFQLVLSCHSPYALLLSFDYLSLSLSLTLFHAHSLLIDKQCRVIRELLFPSSSLVLVGGLLTIYRILKRFETAQLHYLSKEWGKIRLHGLYSLSLFQRANTFFLLVCSRQLTACKTTNNYFDHTSKTKKIKLVLRPFSTLVNYGAIH